VARKQYTEDFRVRAILRSEELGNIRAAARELNIHPETLRTWIRDRPGESAQIHAEVKASMLESLEDGAMKFYRAVMESLENDEYSPGQKLTGFGIITDKVIALRSSSQESKNTDKIDKLIGAIREARANE
jgi:hypothetical protein